MLEDLSSNPVSKRRPKRSSVPTRGHRLTTNSTYDVAFEQQPKKPKRDVKTPVKVQPLSTTKEEHIGNDDYNDDTFAMDVDDSLVDTTGTNAESGDKEQEKEIPENEQVEPSPKPLSIREQLFNRAKATTSKVSDAARHALNKKNDEPATTVNDDATNEPSCASSEKEESPPVIVPSNEVSEWWTSSKADEESLTSAQQPERSNQSHHVNDNGMIQMYWMDAIEVRDRPGKLYLMGKMKDHENETFKSCCIVVENLERYLYVVPKIPKGSKPIAEMETEERNNLWMNIHTELQRLLIPSCITKSSDQKAFQTKLVQRNYAFDLEDMPRGVSYYVKLKYPAIYPLPSLDVCEHGGQTFTRICGRTARPVESFVIRRKLLGPCWIDVNHVQSVKVASSFCKFEFVVHSPKDIVPIVNGNSRPPPLTVMSLSMKTHVHPQTHQHEIVSISAIIQSNVNSDGSTKDLQSFQHFTLIRPIDTGGMQTTGFPPDYATAAASERRFGSKETFRIEMNERALLMYFLTRVQKYDPDVLVGHHIHLVRHLVLVAMSFVRYG